MITKEQAVELIGVIERLAFITYHETECIPSTIWLTASKIEKLAQIIKEGTNHES